MRATGESPCVPTPATRGLSSPRATPRAHCLSVWLLWQINLARFSLGPPFRSQGGTGRNTSSRCNPETAAASSENHLELTIDRPATLWLQLAAISHEHRCQEPLNLA